VIVLASKRKESWEAEERDFEKQLLIHRPEAYKEYQRKKEEQKEENLGYDAIEWRTPETLEEVMELTRIIQEAHGQVEDNLNIEDQEGWEEKLKALQTFSGIDINLLGDEDA